MNFDPYANESSHIPSINNVFSPKSIPETSHPHQHSTLNTYNFYKSDSSAPPLSPRVPSPSGFHSNSPIIIAGNASQKKPSPYTWVVYDPKLKQALKNAQILKESPSLNPFDIARAFLDKHPDAKPLNSTSEVDIAPETAALKVIQEYRQSVAEFRSLRMARRLAQQQRGTHISSPTATRRPESNSLPQRDSPNLLRTQTTSTNENSRQSGSHSPVVLENGLMSSENRYSDRLASLSNSNNYSIPPPRLETGSNHSNHSSRSARSSNSHIPEPSQSPTYIPANTTPTTNQISLESHPVSHLPTDPFAAKPVTQVPVPAPDQTTPLTQPQSGSSIQSFLQQLSIESGLEPELLEHAFHRLGSDRDKTRDFCSKFAQIADWGFSNQQLSDALLENELNLTNAVNSLLA